MAEGHQRTEAAFFGRRGKCFGFESSKMLRVRRLFALLRVLFDRKEPEKVILNRLFQKVAKSG